MVRTLARRYKDARVIGYQKITNTATYVFLEPTIEDRADGVILIVCTSILDEGRKHYRRLYEKENCDGLLLETHTRPHVTFDPSEIMRI